jgi:integrase
MPKHKLTQAFVDHVQPENIEIVYWDEALTGFGLKITPTGKVSYILQTRIAGKEYKRSLYKADIVKLNDARNRARALLGKIADGENPFATEQKEVGTLKKLSDKYIEEHAKKEKKPRCIEGDLALLRNHILPSLGELDPETVSRKAITKFRNAVEGGKTADLARKLGICTDNRLKGGEICANRCLALLSKIFNFADQESYIERNDNPVNKVKRYKENIRDKYLTGKQAIAFRRAIRNARKNRTHKRAAIYAIEMLMVTGARLSEVNALRWSEVSLDEGIIRKEDAKTKDRIIPLSKRAILILKVRRKACPRNAEFVFPNKLGKPICLRKTFKALRKAANLPDWFTPHILRHTFASHAAMNGKSAFQIANILGHKTMETTKRYTKFSPTSGQQDANDVLDGMFE